MRVAGLAGLALFLLFFALTFHVPEWVETFAKDYIEREVRQALNARIDDLGSTDESSAVERLAAAWHERNRQQVEDIKAKLKDRSRELFSVALAQVRDMSCECRQRIDAFWRAVDVSRLGELLASNQRIQAFIHASYMEVANDVRREVRVFTAVNATAFLLLLVVSLAKPGGSRHLLVPGVLLLCATVVCI